MNEFTITLRIKFSDDLPEMFLGPPAPHFARELATVLLEEAQGGGPWGWGVVGDNAVEVIEVEAGVVTPVD